MKVVLDTNVFVAAYFNRRSASAKILDLCSKNECKLIVSPRLRRETRSILMNIGVGRKFRERMRKLLQNASRVKPIEKVRVIQEDQADNKFLECALKGKADYLITSDRHLLRLGKFARTKICKPTQFVHEIRSLKS